MGTPGIAGRPHAEHWGQRSGLPSGGVGCEGLREEEREPGSLLTKCCPQCCLACHKKCLETLAIQCGHKKLQGRLQLFGQDFGQAARGTPDGVPFIIKKCVHEIERRALRTKVTTGDGGRGSVLGAQRGGRRGLRLTAGCHRAYTG